MRTKPARTVETIQLAVREDAQTLADGYMAAISVVGLIGKLAVLLWFILHQNPKALPTVIAMPAMMLVFGAVRLARAIWTPRLPLGLPLPRRWPARTSR